jgi:hypothetical protein
MGCTRIENFLAENDCRGNDLPIEVQSHIGVCRECQEFYRFAIALNLQTGSFEKAPGDLLPAIEQQLSATLQQRKTRELSFNIFAVFAKPAFAVFSLLLIVGFAYHFISDRNIGYVDNLSDRFKIAQFEYIKVGDVIYSGDNTIATIRLKEKVVLNMHHNSIIRIAGSKSIVLSRGEISILAGDKELQIATPDGIVMARNVNAKITTIAHVENDSVKTETRCVVFNGILRVASTSKETILTPGQKAVLAENGGITLQKQLTAAESEAEKSSPETRKLFAAMESRCDCIYTADPTPGKKTDHQQFLGNEANEKKFRVRIYWQEKGLHESLVSPRTAISHRCSTKVKRDDA